MSTKLPEISFKRLEELLDKEAKLKALELGGVENWGFYGEAIEPYLKYKEEKEVKKLFLEELLETISGYIEEPAGRGCGYGLREEGYKELEALLHNYSITKL